MSQRSDNATLAAMNRVIKQMENDATFTLHTPPPPSFFKCKPGEQVHVMFSYPETGDSPDKTWWNHILKDSPYEGKHTYQGFLHDGIMALSVATEKKIPTLEVHAVRFTPSSLSSLEGDDSQFPVLPTPTPGAVASPKDSFCISGGVIRTRMYPDGLEHTRSSGILDSSGARHDVYFCDAKAAWFNVLWQGTKSCNVGYKLIAGTQVCMPVQEATNHVHHVATLHLSNASEK